MIHFNSVPFYDIRLFPPSDDRGRRIFKVDFASGGEERFLNDDARRWTIVGPSLDHLG
jgi:hypothetical protein